MTTVNNPVFAGSPAKMGGNTGSTALLRQYTFRIPALPEQRDHQLPVAHGNGGSSPAALRYLARRLLENGNVISTIQTNTSAGVRDTVAAAHAGSDALRESLGRVAFHAQQQMAAFPQACSSTMWRSTSRAHVEVLGRRYKQPYQTFVQALAARYKNDSRVEFIGIGTGIWGETRPPTRWTIPAPQAAG